MGKGRKNPAPSPAQSAAKAPPVTPGPAMFGSNMARLERIPPWKDPVAELYWPSGGPDGVTMTAFGGEMGRIAAVAAAQGKPEAASLATDASGQLAIQGAALLAAAASMHGEDYRDGTETATQAFAELTPASGLAQSAAAAMGAIEHDGFAMKLLGEVATQHADLSASRAIADVTLKALWPKDTFQGALMALSTEVVADAARSQDPTLLSQHGHTLMTRATEITHAEAIYLQGDVPGALRALGRTWRDLTLLLPQVLAAANAAGASQAYAAALGVQTRLVGPQSTLEVELLRYGLT